MFEGHLAHAERVQASGAPFFVIAMILSLKFPLWGFGLVSPVLFAYLRPEAARRHFVKMDHFASPIYRDNSVSSLNPPEGTHTDHGPLGTSLSSTNRQSTRLKDPSPR